MVGVDAPVTVGSRRPDGDDDADRIMFLDMRRHPRPISRPHGAVQSWRRCARHELSVHGWVQLLATSIWAKLTMARRLR